MPVYVVGHRNPDCDSIVSAIVYAEIKNLLEPGCSAQPVRIGPVNRETSYVLKKFGFDVPLLIQNAYPQVKDASLDPAITVRKEESLFQCWQVMKKTNAKCVCVVDSDNKLCGIVTTGDIAREVLSRLPLDEIESEDSKRSGKRVPLEVAAGVFTEGQDIKTFTLDDPISEVQEVMRVFDYKQFPVIDEHGQPLGIMGRKHLLERPSKWFILVDHNELSQAVEGLAEAKILEIIDHHRINPVQTDQPVMFLNYPCGSTSTIIGKMASDKGLTLRPESAGLLCAGILSDTLAFRSPTTTEQDIFQARSLAERAGICLEDLWREMLTAGSNLDGMNPRDIIRSDFKEYHIEGLKLGIGQTMVHGTVPPDVISRVQEEMANLAEDGRYDLLVMMLTDVQASGSVILWHSQDPSLIQEAFGVKSRTHFFLDAVVSRKKQVLPPIIEAIRKKARRLKLN